MRKTTVALLALVILFGSAGSSIAQPTASQPATRAARMRVRSPEVAADGTVTLRLLAPQAKAIVADGTIGRHPMTRDEAGLWSVTFGPVEPDVYSYRFVVDGAAFCDPSNSAIKGPTESLLQVSPPAPTMWEMRDVPHGQVHQIWYANQELGVTRRLHVYTPPGYDPAGAQRYPVLYLLHGSGDDDSGWMVVGRANWIFDNLLAERAMRPMIVVMPHGHTLPSGERGPQTGPAATQPATQSPRYLTFEHDLLACVIPLVESNFRVQADAAHRAVAGLSMGGGQSLFLSMRHPELFRSVALFSSGFLDRVGLDAEFPDFAARQACGDYRFDFYWVGCGKADRLLGMNQKIDAWFTAHQIPHEYRETAGSHDWSVWRRYLIEVSPKLFAKQQ